MKRFLFSLGLLLMLGTATMNAQNASNDFALRFFEKVIEAKKDSSVITSPLGVNFVLGMLANGANGQTAQQINDALGVADASALADWHNQLMATFPTLDEKTEFGIANAILLNSAKGYSFLPTYAEQMQTKYDALMKDLNFYEEESTLDYINNWGKEQTRGMIPKVLKTLNPNLISLLMNALYFKGVWTKTFDPQETQKEYFRTADNTLEEIAMMHAEGSYYCAANDIFKTVRLDYGNGSYSMYVMLPHRGHTIPEVLTEMKQSDWMAALVLADGITLSLPQFSSESDLNLVEILKALGLNDMFSPVNADFSRMMDLSGGNLFVSLFKQVAKIEVDENGTKAAAVTIAGLEKSMNSIKEFRADRPFLYAIVENTTSTICFMGQFTGKGPDASAKPIMAGISSPQRNQTPETIYDLTGRRLRSVPEKGIYIIDGKKKLVR